MTQPGAPGHETAFTNYSTQLFRSLFENMTEGVALHTLIFNEAGVPVDYRIIDINPAFEQQTGISQKIAAGAVASSLYGVSPAPYLQEYSQVALTGQPYRFQTYFPPLDRHYDISVVSLPEQGFATIFLDITSRVRNEEKLSALAKFPSENPNPVMRVSNSGELIYANQAAYKKFPKWLFKADKLVSQDLQENVARVFEEQVSREVEITTDDQTFIIDITCLPGENYVNIYGRDITGKKKAESELRKQKEELLRSNADLEQFAYVASHDLQEPLRMVTSYVQLLERRYKGKLDPTADEFIHFAVDGATRMSLLINDLLDFSRVGRRGGKFSLFNAEEPLKRALYNLRTVIAESSAEITYDPLPDVFAGATEISQVFQNLISNALKFHGIQPPKIHISARRRLEDWVFAVQDNGIGIDPQFYDRIFIIFQRLHKRNEYPGTGIGLAICKKIINMHGGKIWVESKPAEGSTFFFSIPDTIPSQPAESDQPE